MLTSEVATRVLEDLRNRAEFVVIDVPPLTLPDALPLVVQADTVIVVARRGRTTRDNAQAVRATLDEIGARQVRVVLTDVPAGRASRYGERSS